MLMALASAASAETAATRIVGVWGWEYAPDMTCDRNPHKMTYDDATNLLTLIWKTPVKYSDGSVSIGDDFKVIALSDDRIETIRVRDGNRGAFVLSADGNTYTFGDPDDPEDVSFDYPYQRCAFAGF
jgi:hypothetical protein